MIFSVLAVPFVYRTIRGLLKDEPTINDDNRNIILAAGNMFIYNGNNVYIEKITSTEDGYSGYGEVEMGIINKSLLSDKSTELIN